MYTNEARKFELRMQRNAQGMGVGGGLGCDVVHKIPTFFLLHDRAPPTFPVLL